MESLPKFDRLDDVLTHFNALNATNSDASATDEQLQQTMQGFQNQFTNSAKDADAFHSLMQTAFGDKYDKKEAENIRQQTLAGDFSWMPEVKVVDESTLADTSGTQGSGIGMGAYDSSSDTIYLSKELLAGDPQKAVDILTEEVGHAIDTRVNTSDSAGDEGELFAKLVGGEELSAEQIQAARSENDHGTIEIDGKTVEVEYGMFSFITDPIKEHIIDPIKEHVIDPVVDTIKDVGGAISDGITSVGDALSDGVNWIGDKVTDGLDFVNNNIVSPILNNIPVVGPWVNDHLVQPGFGLLDTGVNIATNFVDSAIDFSTHALSGAVDIGTNLLVGDFGGAWDSAVDTAQTLGKDVLGFAIETVVLPLKGIASFINDTFNLTETRGLRPEEQQYLETIYGNSIDYDEIRIQTGGGVEAFIGLDPHAVGNDIFIPESYFNADGSLTTAGSGSGLDLLAHEVGHVWQFQNEGASYIGDAILSYGQSQIEQGDRNGAYDFTTAIEEMKPWNEMTPDEQAEIAMVIGEALEAGGGVLNIDVLDDAIDNHNGNSRGEIGLDGDQLNYLENIHDILRAG